MIENKIEKLTYSLEEVSLATSLSVPKLRKDIRNGKLKQIKIGSRCLIAVDELKRYLNSADDDFKQVKHFLSSIQTETEWSKLARIVFQDYQKDYD